jgi:hypothetical protein
MKSFCLLVVVLYIRFRFTASDFPFGIFKLVCKPEGFTTFCTNEQFYSIRFLVRTVFTLKQLWGRTKDIVDNLRILSLLTNEP